MSHGLAYGGLVPEAAIDGSRYRRPMGHRVSLGPMAREHERHRNLISACIEDGQIFLPGDPSECLGHSVSGDAFHRPTGVNVAESEIVDGAVGGESTHGPCRRVGVDRSFVVELPDQIGGIGDDRI